MTKEKLQEREKELHAHLEQLIGEVNAVRGAMNELKHFMVELDKEVGT